MGSQKSTRCCNGRCRIGRRESLGCRASVEAVRLGEMAPDDGEIFRVARGSAVRIGHPNITVSASSPSLDLTPARKDFTLSGFASIHSLAMSLISMPDLSWS